MPNPKKWPFYVIIWDKNEGRLKEKNNKQQKREMEGIQLEFENWKKENFCGFNLILIWSREKVCGPWNTAGKKEGKKVDF